MRNLFVHLLIAVALLLGACSTSRDTATLGTVPVDQQSKTPTPPVTASPPSPPRSLTIWIAPIFAPDPATPAGTLFAERLASFEQANPGMTVSVRIKGEGGRGGLLESLVAAHNAAPSALPDIIALNPTSLTTATLKGMIHPLDGLIDEPKSPEWYDFAHAAASNSGGFFSLPFASEAEILAYKTNIYSEAPTTWSAILAVPATFAFPAGDGGAAYTLAQYLHLGGPLLDDQGSPTLDPSILEDILAIYNSAQIAGVLSASVHLYSSAVDTWAALHANQAASAFAPLSVFLTEGDFESLNAVPLPTRSSPGFCLTDTWSWAIVTRDPTRQNVAVELITWLTQPEFLGPWTYALGMLPPTASGLDAWPESQETTLVSGLVTVARPRPSAEALATFGPPLRNAVEAVIRGNVTAATAALDALEALQNR